MKNEQLKMTWKQRIAFAIFTGLTYALILYLFDLFIWENPAYTINGLIFQAVFFGLFFGLGFPYIMGKYGNKFGDKLSKNIVPELESDETIETEGLANLFRGVEAVGGKLFLTNKHLIFKSHNMNFQKGQTTIPYNSITEFSERKTAKLVDNGIRIKTNQEKEYDFVVNNREEWLDKLKSKLNLT